MIDPLEMAARHLCRADGVNPDAVVVHPPGADTTAEEWEEMFVDETVPPLATVSPAWRLYRARAALEMTRCGRLMSGANNVVRLIRG